jgi:hypothetical protein
MLFFELLCIRWVPSYVRYLSYSNNFILLASFLVIGLGMLTARRQRFWYLPFPLLVLVMVIIVGLNRFELHITTNDVIYYIPGADQTGSTEERPGLWASPLYKVRHQMITCTHSKVLYLGKLLT